MLLFKRKKPKEPEELIDAVIKDIEHRLTEANIQITASNLIRQKIQKGDLSQTDVDESAIESLNKLKSVHNELIAKRNQIIIKARNADMRLAIERVLMETDSMPAENALDLLNERIQDIESQSDAVNEIRKTTGGDLH